MQNERFDATGSNLRGRPTTMHDRARESRKRELDERGHHD